MKKITLLVVSCLLLFACSDDDVKSSKGELKLTGTILSPKSSFPISRAKVQVFDGDILIAEKVSDALGAFEIDNLPKGELTIELSKGKFKRELAIHLLSDYQLTSTESNLDIFPRIAVVTGYFDEIEQVLINIGLVNPLTDEPLFDIIDGNGTGRFAAHNHQQHNRQIGVARSASSMPSNVDFSFQTLLNSPDLLDDYDIIFLNCGANETFAADPVASANLAAFIENGGIVYATDWMFKYVQSMFDATDYVAFSQPQKAGNSLSANAQVLNADLQAWLEAQGVTVDPYVVINDFLSSWQMIDTYNPTNVMGWLNADVTYGGAAVSGKSLAVTFQYGSGGVFYSSFHTHGNEDEDDALVQIMNYFVFELSEL